MTSLPPDPAPTCTAFVGHRRLASGPVADVAVALQRALREDPHASPLAFDDATGRPRDFDLRGSEDDVRARHADPVGPGGSSAPGSAPEARGRGRPRLGVVPREVTLLPEHWAWLAEQPGGASVALRKLVHEARRAGGARERARHAQERAYHVMSALAGDLPGFEEASRALFAGDRERFHQLLAAWPVDVREHVAHLAEPEGSGATA